MFVIVIIINVIIVIISMFSVIIIIISSSSSSRRCMISITMFVAKNSSISSLIVSLVAGAPEGARMRHARISVTMYDQMHCFMGAQTAGHKPGGRKYN